MTSTVGELSFLLRIIFQHSASNHVIVHLRV